MKPGGSFDYAFQILNARRDPATDRPRLQTQVRIWRGGKAIYEGPRTPLSLEGPGGERVAAGGRLNLGANLEPGDYGLQVIVADTLAPSRAQRGHAMGAAGGRPLRTAACASQVSSLRTR